MLDNQSKNDITPLIALIAVGLIFIYLITSGWSQFLINESGNKWLAYPVGFVVSLIAIVLAKSVASERIRLSKVSNDAFKNTWMAYFFVLFLLSSVGTMNFLFGTFESPKIVANIVDNTRDKLDILENVLSKEFPASDIIKDRARIDPYYFRFNTELTNPGNCGWGVQTDQLFRELQTQLVPAPGAQSLLQMLSASSSIKSDCAKATLFSSQYAKQYEAALTQFFKLKYPSQVSNGEFIKENTDLIEKTKKQLIDLKNTNGQKDPTKYKPVLYEAWGAYSDILNRAEKKLNDRRLGIARSAKDSSVDIEDIGRFITVLSLMLSDLKSPMTYIIFILAVVLDLIMILIFGRYLVSITKDDEEFSQFNRYSSNTSIRTKNPLD